MTILYAGGCSFTAGEHPQLIKQDNKSWCNYLGFDEVLNKSWPGSSNTTICRKALEFLAAGGVADFFAIQLSGFDRREIIMPLEKRKTIPLLTETKYVSINIWSVERFFPDQMDFYINHMRGDKTYDDMLTSMNIIALEHILQKRGIPYVFFNGINNMSFHDLEPTHPAVQLYKTRTLIADTPYFMPHTTMRKYYDLKAEHPSEDQHKDWGLMLAEYIKKV
jgi:hypothetical protein